MVVPLIDGVYCESGGCIRPGPGLYAQCKVFIMSRAHEKCQRHKDRWKHFMRQYENQYTTKGMVDLRVAWQFACSQRAFHPWEITMMSEHPGMYC